MNIVLLILSFFAGKTNYCKCADYAGMDEKKYSQYQVIFTGKGEKIETTQLGQTIVFKIDKYYKALRSDTMITIHTGTSSCDNYHPKAGEEWLIYADHYENILSIAFCSPSTNLDPNHPDFWKSHLKTDLIFLETKRKELTN